MPTTWHIQHLLLPELSSTITADSPGSSLLPSHLVASFVTVTESQGGKKNKRDLVAELSLLRAGWRGFCLQEMQKEKKKKVHHGGSSGL